MTKHHSRTFVRLLCTAVLAAQAACSPYGESGGPAAEVTLRILPDGYSLTRSSFTWGEDEIRDIQVVVTTENGEIHDILYSDSPDDLHFTGTVGRLYRLWAAANIGGKVEAESLEDFTEGVRQVSKAGIERTGIPMYSDGTDRIFVTDGENHTSISLKRMMARVDFNLDTRSLDSPEGFTVSGVRIYNPVDAYTPFSESVRKGHSGQQGYTFDSASIQDLSRLNSGGTIRLYAFENMQGTLLPGNTDPWRKVPSRIGEAGPYCTFLEVTCMYDTGMDSCDDITYRLYLGADAMTNFDVKRNTIYRLTLEPTEEEIRGGRGSWKIETGEWEDNVEVGLIIDPSYMELVEGESGTASTYFILTYPDGRTQSQEAYSNWSASSASSQIVRFSPRYVMNGYYPEKEISAEGIAPGSVVVTASARYGETVYYAEMEIKVVGKPHVPVYSEEYEYELVVSPQAATLAEGETVSFTATYITREYTLADGVRISNEPASVTQDDVTASATWEIRSGSQYVVNMGNGTFGWTYGPGSATVRATYEGYSDTAAVNTLAHEVIYSTEYEYELVVSPQAATLAEGETVSFTATYITREYTLADGVRISGEPVSVSNDDVTEIVLWEVTVGSQYVTSKGSGLFKWVSGPGSATVSAMMNGFSDSAVITTLAHEVIYSKEYEYELVVSPQAATLAEGETVSFTATYITREYTLADGVRISNEPASVTQDDVTASATWEIRSGSQYVVNMGNGTFGWTYGPGSATFRATYEGYSDTAAVNTLAHEVIYSTEYEYELVVSPQAATLAEGETVSFTATYITREYTLADGVRISNEPASVTQDDVTASATWEIRSGSRYIDNTGPGIFGWASGPGSATVRATYEGYSDTAAVNTLAHEVIYTTEYEYELMVSPQAATLAEGETVSFTATYITREYTLADGVRISNEPASVTQDDVTASATWEIRSGSRYIDNTGPGIFGWASGPGSATVRATYEGYSDTAAVNTLAHEVIYSTEYEYELVVSPDAATLAEGETVSFTATYITREYTLADGVRISNEPASVTQDDVTARATWEVRSGSQYVLNMGNGTFGWVYGPGYVTVSATYNGSGGTALIEAGAPAPEPTVESIRIVELTGNGQDIIAGSRYDYHLKCIVTMSDGRVYESTDPNDAPDFEWWSSDEGDGVTTGTDGWFEVNPGMEGSLVMSCTYEHEHSADFTVYVTKPARTIVSMVLEEISDNGRTVYFRQSQYIYKATVTFSDGTVIESDDQAHWGDFDWDADLFGTVTGTNGITDNGGGHFYVQGWLDTGNTSYEISCTYDGETRYEYIFVSAPGLTYHHEGNRTEGPKNDTLHVYVTLECDGESATLEVPYLNGLEVGNGYYRFQISYDCLEDGYWTGCSDVVPHGTPAQYNFSVSVDGGRYMNDPPSSL